MKRQLILICGVFAFLTACGTSTVDDLTTTTGSAVTTSQATASTAGATSGDECLVGEWELDVDSFAAAMEAPLTGTGANASVSAESGTGTLTVGADGTSSAGYDNLTMELDLGVEGTPAISMSISGTVDGTWSLEDDTLVLTPGAGSDLEIEATANGESLPVPTEIDTSGLGSARSTITCDGDTLTVQPDVEGAPGTSWTRSG